ncbi:hypothetical protein LCGC14_1488670 [marine sediment metagenome]|uniref:Uncharacterized protein n=1 Tax=marine sediment metagenome TaxID=412755 RepID=A0A0F9M987_9ZZZZ
MSRLAAMASTARLDGIAERIERGEHVDWDRVLALQALDVVRGGRIALAEALAREEEADEQLRQLAEGD